MVKDGALIESGGEDRREASAGRVSMCVSISFSRCD